jgi:cell division protein FtsW
MRILALRREVPLLLPMAVLIGLGWVMVFSTAAVLGVESPHGGVFAHLKRQMIATALGALAMAVIVRVPLERMRALAPAVLAAAAALMLLVFVPGLGKSVARATRWIDFGIVSFQPVEPFKLAMVGAYAALLARQADGAAWSAAAWVRIAGLAGVAAALPLLQRDFGSTVLLLGLGGVLLWTAGARFRGVAAFAIVGAAGAAAMLAAAPYRLHRLQLFIESWVSGRGGYQTGQALIALGSGGLTGVGLGESMQKLLYLPSAHADFIFAVIGEELGFVGAVATIALYVILFREGLAVALAAPDRFGRLLATGASLLLFLQALWHVAVALVLVPTKGLALPFVSYGGSSLIVSMAAVGVLMRCAAESGPRASPSRRSGSGPAARAPAGMRVWAPS